MMLRMKPLLDRGGTGEFDDDDFEPGPRRTAVEVARRAIILCCVAASKAFPPGEFNAWLEREGLWKDVSPKEVELLTAKEPTERQRIDSSWRSEALQVLLWSIGKLPSLPPIVELVNVGRMLDAMPEPGSDTASFISSAVLRPDSEIDEELECIVQSHWEIRNSRMYPEETHGPMIDGVVVERHWALAWLENYDDEPWDQTPLTT
jgi:Domain of unknown function (DUF4272)